MCVILESEHNVKERTVLEQLSKATGFKLKTQPRIKSAVPSELIQQINRNWEQQINLTQTNESIEKAKSVS